VEAIAWLGLGIIGGTIFGLYLAKKARESQARHDAQRWKTQPRFTEVEWWECN
jgi:uncharacterized protein YneF (UPF0154 family)